VQENHNTYTYTARNTSDPTKVMTFTLYDHHMGVNLTGILDQARVVVGTDAEEKPAEIKNQLSYQAKPAAMKFVEYFSGPAHVSDVNAYLADENLKVTLWQRLGGLRLAPIQFDMGKIDNVESADAFVDELEQRKKSASYAGKFSGFLDYRVGWISLLLVGGIFLSWLRRPDET